MTLQTTTGDIGDIFLGMVFFGFLLVMAGIAVYRVITRGMAAAAIPVGSSVIHWEGVAEIRRLPGIGGVALRALPGVVVGGPVLGMAGIAVVEPLVAEARRPPGFGSMALRALPGVMVGRPILGMAGCAVGEALVAEVRRPPGVGGVALGALPGEVVGRPIPGMAGCAVGEALVAEARWPPGIGIVAL
jgi:hypothetical protein